MHLIGGWYRGSFQWMEQVIVSALSFVSKLFENMYRSRQPVMLLVIVLVVALFFIFKNSAGVSP